MPGERDKHLGIRVTETEKETLARAAARKRRTVSDFVRLAAMDKAQEALTAEHCKTRTA